VNEREILLKRPVAIGDLSVFWVVNGARPQISDWWICELLDKWMSFASLRLCCSKPTFLPGDRYGIRLKRLTLFTLLKINDLNVYKSFTNQLHQGQVVEYKRVNCLHLVPLGHFRFFASARNDQQPHHSICFVQPPRAT
jgi:hypothetical protein